MRRFLHLLAGLVARVLCRLEVCGAENLPAAGPVLLVSNHISYLDAIVIMAAVPRPVRFLIGRKFYDMRLIGLAARMAGAMPVSRGDAAGSVMKSLEHAVEALKKGDAVCLFPEGAITRTGHLHPFRRGFELLARRAAAPILPLYLDGLQGGVFTPRETTARSAARILRRGMLRRRVSVVIGRPLPPDASVREVRQAVMELGCKAYSLRKRLQRPLHVEFWRTARRNWFRWCMADSTGIRLTWGEVLLRSLIMARRIRSLCPERMVGIMLPPSVAAVVSNVAAYLAGKVPVNINFSGGEATLRPALDQCKIRTVFTTRALLERVGGCEGADFLLIEDLVRRVRCGEKVRSFLMALLCTASSLHRRWKSTGGHMDETATVMFTSGSTGEPKGVILTHHNVVSNIEAVSEVLGFRSSDVIMGVLPPFHSFGFTTTIWAPLMCGVRVVYHPNPLDAKGVGAMVRRYGATIIIGTSSFYALYTRRCAPEEFRSLRFAVAGAQKLLPSVAEAFERKFGLPISEGYGCTELSPVVSFNVPDVRFDGELQRAWRAGSVGRPLPGLAVRFVSEEAADSDTWPSRAEWSRGVLLVKGPSVMKGYLDRPDATHRVLRDGWYLTGDVAEIDDDGFLHIHDRLSRFSKIAGEMVPHAAVEDALHRAAGSAENEFVVLSVEDRMRGERLVVAYSGPEVDPDSLLKRMSDAGVPALWLPSVRDFHRVESIPLLPSGKPNIPALRRLLQRRGRI